MTQPCDLTATEARRLIGTKALSPVELMASCIARTEAVDHAVNAMVARDFERATTAAKQAETTVMQGKPLGALHGLPVGIKDLVDTEGLRTTYGSPLYADHVPKADRGLVRAIKAAGGIVFGKTNTPEWGAGANTRNAVYGATGNPFDPQRSCAGSSGGSAVALACGMVPLASGSDTGGSLRNPAAFCGIVGFRPTPGLVPYEWRPLGWSPLPVQGPMARTVPDAALLLGAMASDDAGDPLATTIAGRTIRGAADFALADCDLASLRVAFSEDFGFAPVERTIRTAFAEKTALFRTIFARADDASPDCTGSDEVFEILRAVNFVAAHEKKVRDTPDKVGPNVHANVKEALGYTAADVGRAEATQTAIYRRWQAFFAGYDVLLTPSITISPRPWSELFPAEIDGQPTRTYFHWLALAYAVTIVGHPALSLPVGRDANGLPFGLQIIGRRGADAQVLAVAAALERHLAADPRTARPLPDIAALTRARKIADSPGFLGFD